MAIEFRMKRQVQFSETDMAGVMHFSNYYRLMEDAEHAFWRSVGLSVMTPDGDRLISWPRVATKCDYFAPVHFEDELELILTIGELGNRSVAFDVEFLRDGKKVAAGQLKAVCCATADGRFESIPIPDAIRRKLEAQAASV